MNDLIATIHLINLEAAHWLDANRGRLNSGAANLRHLMVWNETPQGYRFWRAIHDQIEDNSPEARVSRGAAWLDRRYPGWARSAEGARISSINNDVLCRAVPGHGDYGHTRDAVGLTFEQSHFLGLDQTTHGYQILWNKAIAERLEEDTHPFTIHSDGSVSYGSDSMTAEQVETTILAYRRKKTPLGVVVQSWRPELVYSHLQIGCQRFPIKQIEAFIEEYESRSASAADTMVKHGDRVRINGTEYIVAIITHSSSRSSVALVSLRNGNLWDDPITIGEIADPIRLGDFSDDNFEDETVEVL